MKFIRSSDCLSVRVKGVESANRISVVVLARRWWRSLWIANFDAGHVPSNFSPTAVVKKCYDCINFKTLKDINMDILEAAIRYGFEAQSNLDIKSNKY